MVMLHRRTSNESTEVNITASTTQTQGSGALLAHVNEIETVVNVNDTVTLFTAAMGGEDITVINNGNNILQIFPASGDDLGNGTDVAMTLGIKTQVTLYPTNSTTWVRTDTEPSNIVVITSLAKFDSMASGGIVTISANTTFVLKAVISTINRIVVDNGATLHIVAGNNSIGRFSYSGSDTFLTVNGTLRILSSARIFGTSSGTMLSMSGGGTFNIRDTAVFGWGSLGTYADGTFFNFDVSYISCLAGYVITNPNAVNVAQCDQSGATLVGAMYKITSNNLKTSIKITDFQATTLSATSALLDLNTRINNNLVVNVQNCTTIIGTLFKQTSIANATIDSVADAPVAAGDITVLADDGNDNTIVSVSEITYFEDEEVTIAGTTNANGTFQIFEVVAGVSFKIRKAFVATEAVVDAITTKRITMTLAASHGVTSGMSIKVINSQFYNLFYTVLNLSGDIITLNAIFATTDSGEIERNVGLDQTDSRIDALINDLNPDSQEIAFGSVNNNTTLTTITDGTYATINVSGFISSQISEQFVLVDTTIGIWKYIGHHPFKGFLTGGLWAVKTGATGNYRFAMSIDSAVPVFATARFSPMEVKSTQVSMPLEFEVNLVQDQTIQIMAAGDGTSDNLTITDMRMGIK